jgi:hypothetical protein
MTKLLSLADHQCRKNVSLFVQPRFRPPTGSQWSSSSTTSPSSSSSSSHRGNNPNSVTASDFSMIGARRTEEAVAEADGDDRPVSISITATGHGDLASGSHDIAGGVLGGPLSYLIKSVDSPPQIKIAVPGTRHMTTGIHRDRGCCSRPGSVT